MDTIYAQLVAIADSIVKHYRDDLIVHDARICEGIVTGDVAFWFPYVNGTHLYKTALGSVDAPDRQLSQLRGGMEWVRASDQTWGPKHWYMLVSTRGQFGTVTRISMSGIESYASRRERLLRLAAETVTA
jgi:hypothetical protein